MTRRPTYASVNSIHPPTAQACGGAIDCETDTLPTIETIPSGKSPGPDRIPNKFYKTFSAVIGPILTKVFNEAHQQNTLPPSMLEGIITVLYKKRNRNDPRNYRPITLLNCDYKILMRILTRRFSEAAAQFTSPEQTGFCPGAFIGENTMLLKLIQTYLKEENTPGLYIFLDMEKAFDRCSWQYLKKALSALGAGPAFTAWVNLAYSDTTPPTRRVYANGYLGPSFPIRSGVAQGCPLSPLLFLVMAEALTRLINKNPHIKGIQIDDTAHKISQFADDTTLILRPEDVPHALAEVTTWCEATGGLENKNKREALLLGSLVRNVHLAPSGIVPHYLNDDETITSLGVPFNNDSALTEWWLSRYRKVKRRISLWPSIAYQSIKGRNILLQAIWYGSFRYWFFSLIVPKQVLDLIESDANQLLWASDPDLHTNELGSNTRTRKTMTTLASYQPLRHGGANIMLLHAHISAYQAHWIIRYLDPREAPWKLVLDHWLCNPSPLTSSQYIDKDQPRLARGIVLAHVPHRDLAQLIPPSAEYVRQCLRSFESLNIKQNISTKGPAIQGEPLWHNHRFHTPPISHYARAQWINHLQTFIIADLISDEGTPFSSDHWETFAHQLAPPSLRNSSAVHEFVDDRLKDLPKILKAVPHEILAQASAPIPPNLHDGAIVLLLDPINPQNAHWAVTHKTQESNYIMHELHLDTSRTPHRTGQIINHTSPTSPLTIIPAALWTPFPHNTHTPPLHKCQILGPLNNAYPLDDGWLLPDSPSHARHIRLSQLSISTITHHLTRKRVGTVQPHCERNWATRVDYHLNWTLIWNSLSTPLSDTLEEKQWYKLLHRDIFVRNRQNKGPTNCRLCHSEKESQLHLFRCRHTRPYWRALMNFLHSIDIPAPSHTERALIFGLWSDNELGPPEARALLRHGFRIFYRDFTKVDTAKHLFTWQCTYASTLRVFHMATIRRAHSIRKLHASRHFSHISYEPNKRILEDFPNLINIAPDGNFHISSTLQTTLSDAKTAASLQIEERQRRLAEANRRKRPRPPPS